MIGDIQLAKYRRDGFIVVPDVLDSAELSAIRQVIGELVDGAASVDRHTDVYDLEPGHSRDNPRVRRIKSPHSVHPVFDRVVRKPAVIDILRSLIGPDIRLHGSKLNMKSAQYGSPVEWHQDWAFYPHTNDDILAIGVMLDDMTPDNGPLMVSPGSHTGPIFNHHGEDGVFCGAVAPEDIASEIANAVPLVGRAGSMSFHHVRALHGSALNTSDRPRNLLLFEIAAADAWPMLRFTTLEEFNARMLAGNPTVTPRMTPVPVRMPFPPAPHQGSIYENQTTAARTYFKRAAA